MDLVERSEAAVRQRPPVRTILEYVAIASAIARNRQQRRPLIDGDAGVVGLDETYASLRAAVELHDVGHAADTVPDQARENSPFTLGPLAEVGIAGREEALGISATLPRRNGLAINLDVLAGGHLQPAAPKNVFDLRRHHGCPIAV